MNAAISRALSLRSAPSLHVRCRVCRDCRSPATCAALSAMVLAGIGHHMIRPAWRRRSNWVDGCSWRRLATSTPRAPLGKSLMHDPERAPLVPRAFEEYTSGRYTKEQLLKQVRAWGLTNRRRRPLTSQAIGMLPRNQPVYLHLFDVPEYAGTDHLTVQSAASRRLVPSLTLGSARNGRQSAHRRTR